MPHDIIDNRHDKLVDHINTLLPQSERARFAVGYFFLSGFSAIAPKLKDVKELRILIGNTTTRETIEQLAEGYRRMELVERAQQRQEYATDRERKQWSQETAGNIQGSLELMDQTAEAEELVATLARLIEEKRVKVKVYTKGRLHAKAYIFDYTTAHYEPGLGIVGSSNLTLSGIQHNTELNVVVHGSANHEALVKWFDELWDEAQDFDEALLNELKQSWALNPVTPYDIYVKTLYTLVKDRLEEEEAPRVIWDRDMPNLTDFQRDAMNAAVRILNHYGGIFISDVVGLGKTYIGAALLKYYRTVHRMRPVILCPASLVQTWQDMSNRYDLGPVVSIGLLTQQGIDLDRDIRTEDRDIVLIDESDEFRYSDTQRYGKLRTWLTKQPRKVILLTATPRNNTVWDIYNQLKLFHAAERTEVPILPARLREYFKQVEDGNKRIQDLLRHILIRRTRKHITQYYPNAVLPDGRRIEFPKRALDTVTYSIEATYQGVYARLRDIIRDMHYARYGVGEFVKREKRGEPRYRDLYSAGRNLRGLMRVLLFKRFESSVRAFHLTVDNMLRINRAFLMALENGIVPAGVDAQELLYGTARRDGAGPEADAQLLAALEQVSGQYRIDDFEADALKEAIEEDIEAMEEMCRLVDPITPGKDAKLQRLLKLLSQPPCKGNKVLIFTQFSDTLDYLYDNLQHLPNLERINSHRGSPMTIVGRFAPKANPNYVRPGEPPIDNLLSTDVLAKGLNLQDGNVVVNYDIHWNPVRLIQRVGRVDRIGTEHDVVHALNFLPETELEKNLGLQEKVRQRIAEIHNTIGEDAQILERNEQLNAEAMYAIYVAKDESLLDQEAPEDMDILAEAEAFIRNLQKDNPEYFAKIAAMPDGVRSGRDSPAFRGAFVFCQAAGYQQLYLLNLEGSIQSTDIEKALALLRCPPGEPRQSLPENHNSFVVQALRDFRTQVEERQAQTAQAPSRRRGQAYVVNQLRALLRVSREATERETIITLERALNLESLPPPVHTELNRLRKNKVAGADLLGRLAELYRVFGLGAYLDGRSEDSMPSETPFPRVVCSEAMS
ncbi:MAG: helicase-related protein [Chloroflexota bacterium]